MSHDTTLAERLATAAHEALTEGCAKNVPEAATSAAEELIRTGLAWLAANNANAAFDSAAGTIADQFDFLLMRIGPQAATRVVANITAAVNAEIARSNAGTMWLQ